MNAHSHDYPDAPGHRGIDTSVEASAKIASYAPVLRDQVLKGVLASGPSGLTVLEGCERFGWDRHGAQPRFTELKVQGKIVDSGQRRRNPSGVRAIVWVTPETQSSFRFADPISGRVA